MLLNMLDSPLPQPERLQSQHIPWPAIHSPTPSFDARTTAQDVVSDSQPPLPLPGFLNTSNLDTSQPLNACPCIPGIDNNLALLPPSAFRQGTETPSGPDRLLATPSMANHTDSARPILQLHTEDECRGLYLEFDPTIGYGASPSLYDHPDQKPHLVPEPAAIDQSQMPPNPLPPRIPSPFVASIVEQPPEPSVRSAHLPLLKPQHSHPTGVNTFNGPVMPSDSSRSCVPHWLVPPGTGAARYAGLGQHQSNRTQPLNPYAHTDPSSAVSLTTNTQCLPSSQSRASAPTVGNRLALERSMQVPGIHDVGHEQPQHQQHEQHKHNQQPPPQRFQVQQPQAQLMTHPDTRAASHSGPASITQQQQQQQQQHPQQQQQQQLTQRSGVFAAQQQQQQKHQIAVQGYSKTQVQQLQPYVFPPKSIPINQLLGGRQQLHYAQQPQQSQQPLEQPRHSQQHQQRLISVPESKLAPPAHMQVQQSFQVSHFVFKIIRNTIQDTLIRQILYYSKKNNGLGGT